uniref:Uncharacterized protein n=1 Tax=Rhizophora mucronata TaxID=61149 RepID=A0A2P2PP71_RHIMU
MQGLCLLLQELLTILYKLETQQECLYLCLMIHFRMNLREYKRRLIRSLASMDSRRCNSNQIVRKR